MTTSSVNSSLDLEVEVDEGETPDLSSLTWKFESTGDPVSLPVTESGPGGGTANDGIYTAEFLPAGAGRVDVRFTIALTLEGTAVERTAAVSFDVIDRTAMLQSQQTQLVDEDGNGRPDRLAVTFNTDVTRAGTYMVKFTLESAGGSRRTFLGSAALPAGQGQLGSISRRGN